ncbi:MAG: 3-dehydroquinate synthase [Cetobacterium sp.]
MYKLKMNTKSKQYSITIGNNIIDKINSSIENFDKILLLTNTTVGSLYGKEVLNKLFRKDIFYFEIPDGEIYKNEKTLMDIYTFMIENNFNRNSLIISLGGGVVCDIGGFAAGTFMRGIEFIQCPTSLLAQVDASIGGKVAVNHPLGKNMIGLFKQPLEVFIDTNFLKTLPEIEFKSGLGEVLKHSFISKDKNYFNFLRKNIKEILSLDENILEEMIYYSCEIKKSIVEDDELETGIRAYLNLGHTYGHALETLYNFQHISHGEGVAKGIIFAGALSKKLNYITQEEFLEIQNLFLDFKLDCEPVHVEINRLIELMMKDKKNSLDSINFILFKNGYLTKEKVALENISHINDIFSKKYLKAIVDIGTNSCRLFIGEVEKNNHQITISKKLYKGVTTTRLGQDVNKNRYLLPEAMERTVEALEAFSKISKSMGVCEIKAFATSATRDSENRDYFIDLVKKRTNIEIICIPGKLEAKFGFLGNSSRFENKIMIIDIGGGSTEFALGEKDNLEFARSFNVGVVRATEIFFKDQNYSTENILQCQKWFQENLEEILDFRNLDFTLVGVAGSVTTNVSVLKSMEIYDPEKVDLYPLSRKEIESNLALFMSKDLEERKKIVGLQYNRADVIISGNLLLLTIMDMLNKNTIIVSESDNLEGGMIYENISFHN